LWAKFLAAALVLAVVTAGGVAIGVMRWQQAPLPVTDRAVVVLEPGEPFARFAERLHARGLVEHPRLLTWFARLTGEAHRVQAGEYEITGTDTPASLVAKLTAGNVITYRVKIVEGWTAMQAVGVLKAHPALERRLDGVSVHTLLDVLGLPGGHAEGLFFPDTYQFVRGDSDADILRRAYLRMESVLDEAWRVRDAGLPYDSPYEVLIAASLIEKETGRESDRPVISQVFSLRLQRGMRLQTDPTVIYGLGDTFDGNLRRADLREVSPYNTYLNRGLPPTPIALPGASSIRAAVHPADGEYLYFVSRGDGSSQFSVSLEEHEQAVRRYQLGRHSRGSGRDG
jgi:UPF0755 protein